MFLCESIKEKATESVILPVNISAQATSTTSYHRLLNPTLPSLPHFVGTTIRRALQRTQLDK